MDKKGARRNLLLALVLLAASAVVTGLGLFYIQFFMSLPR
jgi:hypothetical protein